MSVFSLARPLRFVAVALAVAVTLAAGAASQAGAATQQPVDTHSDGRSGRHPLQRQLLRLQHRRLRPLGVDGVRWPSGPWTAPANVMKKSGLPAWIDTRAPASGRRT